MNPALTAHTGWSFDAPRQRPAVRRFSVHGLSLELTVDQPALLSSIDHLFGDFELRSTDAASANSADVMVRGSIQTYAERDVMKRVSATARSVPVVRTLAATGRANPAEIYQDGARVWIVDERWGLGEIDFLRNRWTCWVLPTTSLSPAELVESMVHWPLHQLLRSRELHLLPAASVSRPGMGVLLLAPFQIGPELRSMIGAGFRVIGQRWTALRHTRLLPINMPLQRYLEVCQMPGWVDVPAVSSAQLGLRRSVTDRSLDLGLEHCGSASASAMVNTVVLIQPARRPTARLRRVRDDDAVAAIRRAWPILEMHPSHQRSPILSELADRCCVFEATVSQNPADLAELLIALSPASVTRRKLAVTLNAPALASASQSARALRIA